LLYFLFNSFTLIHPSSSPPDPFYSRASFFDSSKHNESITHPCFYVLLSLFSPLSVSTRDILRTPLLAPHYLTEPFYYWPIAFFRSPPPFFPCRFTLETISLNPARACFLCFHFFSVKTPFFFPPTFPEDKGSRSGPSFLNSQRNFSPHRGPSLFFPFLLSGIKVFLLSLLFFPSRASQ